MGKYKCKSCKKTFESDSAPSVCPHCDKSVEFIPMNKSGVKVPKWAWVIASVVAAILLLVLLIKGCDPSGTATLSPEGGVLKITVGDINKGKLKSGYKVEVLVDAERVDMIGFNGRDNVAVYDMQRMMVGVMYTFRIVSAKDKKPANEIRWTNSYQYQIDALPPAPVFACPAYEKVRNQERKEWTVVVSIADTSSADSYAMVKQGDEDEPKAWQSSNEFVFASVPGGLTLTIWAKNDSGERSTDIYLEEIKDLPKPITKAEVQAVLDGVSSGRVSLSAAQDKLAGGNVNLSRSVTTSDGGQMHTLLDVLMEASGFQTRFFVNGFQLDPTTNKIKSGTLSISVR